MNEDGLRAFDEAIGGEAFLMAVRELESLSAPLCAAYQRYREAEKTAAIAQRKLTDARNELSMVQKDYAKAFETLREKSPTGLPLAPRRLVAMEDRA